MSLTLEEAKNFISFCVAKNVTHAKFGDLEFALQLVFDDKTSAQANRRVPTEEELLFYGAVTDENAGGNAL